VLSAIAGATGGGVTASLTEGALSDPADMLADGADGVVFSELQAANVMTADAAQATNATEENTRKDFTVVTLHPHHAILCQSPVSLCYRIECEQRV
jgi:hypothetical protein